MLTSVDKFPTQIAGMESKFMLYLSRGDTMTLGNRLYEMRKSKGLSQENVAEMLGVTRQTISKWETDQSTPDFDKIIPLCKLYEISTQELLTGKKQENENADYSNAEDHDDDRFNYYNNDETESTDNDELTNQTSNPRKKFAILTSIAVCMYILSIVPLIILDGSTTAAAIFFIIIALATMLIVFGALSKPKAEHDDKVITNQKRLYKQITGILSGITVCLYLIISFLTNDWHITWIIWIIYGILCKIIDLILTLKEGEKNGEK